MAEKINNLQELKLYDYFPKPRLEINEKKLHKISKLFAEVFAEEPWNEYKICPSNHYTGKNQIESICKKCNGELSLAYPEDETVEYIRKEVEKSNGLLSAFEDNNGTVLGVGWGFSCTGQEFAGKYSIEEMRKKGLDLIKNYLIKDEIFYLSEILVDPLARNKGIATQIAKKIIDHAASLGLKTTLHTHAESSMARIAEKLGMLRIMSSKEDSEIIGRVVYVSNY